MAEWWLLNEATQEAIAHHVDQAAANVVERFDVHGNENSLTAAFGQELLRESLTFGDTTVRFKYRNFLEQTEEPQTGADGGIIVSIRTPEDDVRKGVLFQAKRLPQRRGVRSLTISADDARRLRRQVDQMCRVSEESIVLVHTREQIYAVDALMAQDLSLNDLRRLTDISRLLSIGTYLGKWVSRCARGDRDPEVLRRLGVPGGFVRHSLEMSVATRQRPVLMEGGREVSPITIRGAVPVPRWRT